MGLSHAQIKGRKAKRNHLLTNTYTLSCRIVHIEAIHWTVYVVEYSGAYL